MKPLFHPSIEDVTVEAVLHALSDPVRVGILAQIVSSEQIQCCSELVSLHDKPIPRSTLSQHFRVLREAGLIRGERRGVEMYNTSRCAEVESRFPGLTSTIANAYQMQKKRTTRAKPAVQP